MAHMNRLVVLLLFFLLICISRCEARHLRESKKNSLLNALFILKFAKTVEATYPPLPPPNANNNGDIVSLSDNDETTPSVTNPPFCVNPPNTPTPPSTSTPDSPFIPEQPPPLPPFSLSPPSFEPSPPEITPNPPTVTPNTPKVAPSPPETVPSPISIVPSPPSYTPSPPEFVPGPGIFLPPIVYPPPLAPPLPPGAGEALWCVAKPTVPDPIIQEAMDYACGSGAECKSILPSGPCYQPNTVLAHASYAFNSYWQKTKVSGGTCDFGGTATIVTRDPSYEKCQFNLL